MFDKLAEKLFGNYDMSLSEIDPLYLLDYMNQESQVCSYEGNTTLAMITVSRGFFLCWYWVI